MGWGEKIGDVCLHRVGNRACVCVCVREGGVGLKRVPNTMNANHFIS